MLMMMMTRNIKSVAMLEVNATHRTGKVHVGLAMLMAAEMRMPMLMMRAIAM